MTMGSWDRLGCGWGIIHQGTELVPLSGEFGLVSIKSCLPLVKVSLLLCELCLLPSQVLLVLLPVLPAGGKHESQEFLRGCSVS